MAPSVAENRSDEHAVRFSGFIIAVLVALLAGVGLVWGRTSPRPAEHTAPSRSSRHAAPPINRNHMISTTRASSGNERNHCRPTHGQCLESKNLPRGSYVPFDAGPRV